jgi:signal transduction histidine kinase
MNLAHATWGKLQSLWRAPFWQPRPDSAEYQAWRHQFLLDRLGITLWIAFPVATALSANNIMLYWQSPQFAQDLFKLYEDATLIVRLRTLAIADTSVTLAILLSCLLLYRIHWGRRHPTVIFLLFSSILALNDLIVGTFFGLPVQPNPSFFLVQAILFPVYWRLHLISQLVPIAYYAIVYPLLGLTKIGNRPIYNTYSIEFAINLCWMGVICILSVYLYERLKRSEFESRRQLRSVIHAVSHDLKNPVMGTSVVLQSLLTKPHAQVLLDRTILEQLLAGSDRQLKLINTLLAAQSAEVGALILQCQSLQLNQLINDIVNDLEGVVRHHHMTLINQAKADLPPINGDQTQLWRVFNNLISNAIKHNSSGTQITIAAEVIGSPAQWLRCTVQDNGSGIPSTQLPHLFKLYSRGAKARRMPGLGLGLYLCQQIITAHGGEIDVISQPERGSTFWFTLPVAQALGGERE